MYGNAYNSNFNCYRLVIKNEVGCYYFRTPLNWTEVRFRLMEFNIGDFFLYTDTNPGWEFELLLPEIIAKHSTKKENKNMLTSIGTETNKPSKNFPKLLKNIVYGYVILVTERTPDGLKGMVVKEGNDGSNKLGDYYPRWIEDGFEVYHGSVTLTQE